ncbi:histidine kinase N-terminal 7TM domain-containing protein [Halobacterium salinarum]|uniref:histidine kinase n=4 Tax=Halobacterium salinarum TaxID=2242 RepID=A0A510N8K3_HALSA|nr:histidine kinase N-terminal 7TM domain-containing protein [Halobacterium salinarum]MBB6089332.1 signal transduction histidine kinase [Halobacterium salinarum]MDL0120466.1 histidine kinase N-terminal 7TM domain-containing protein [Halobacterium salinarum]MDL0129560.1 histidine kinase N-terminal 7TM domain-containing protein [Halobacterium salinarum]MDL0142661.1 histidine kinase N-terminal 7TM domain-containing protein [Halobacterium salinarum]UEB91668.1 sensor histidine kinase [Halobacterium
MPETVLGLTLIDSLYAGLFVLGAVLTAASILQATRIEDRETRHGLIALLATASGWSVTHVVTLLAPSQLIANAAYLAGLILGFSTVWAWLYFCSAYTGRVLHRDTWVVRGSILAYLSVVAVKLTNPFHHLYYRATYQPASFPAVVVEHGIFHWAVTGLSYALAAIGMFMLFELFREADYGTRPLAGLVAVMALPAILDVYSFASSTLVDLIHSPLGVAVFAVGVLFIHEDRFLAVQLTGDIAEPVALLDEDDRVRAVNDTARSRFPTLRDATGVPLSTAAPAIAEHVDGDDDVLALRHSDDTEYYLVAESTFSLGASNLGRVIVFTEITETERHRREVERHNAQLEGFAAGVNHELRNAIQVASGYTAQAASALESENVTDAQQSLARVSDAVDRMADRVNDLSTLARHGRTLRDTTTVDVAAAARAGWQTTDTGDCELTVTGDTTVSADRVRLEDLFESAFAFTTDNNATAVTVAIHDDGFSIADNGATPSVTDTTRFFDYGDAVPTTEAGMHLPNVQTLARVHGWTVSVDPDYEDGVRLEITTDPAPIALTDP